MTAQAYTPQKRYTEKQKDQGLTKVTVWVPEYDREKTLKYAAKLRREHEKNI